MLGIYLGGRSRLFGGGEGRFYSTLEREMGI